MTIGDAARRTGVSETTLRYYEKKGLLRVARRSGIRAYTENDIVWIAFIRRLKETGMLLRDIRVYAQLRYDGDATLRQRMQMLEKHRAYVLRQQQQWADNLQNLDRKIALYQQKIAKEEEGAG